MKCDIKLGSEQDLRSVLKSDLTLVKATSQEGVQVKFIPVCLPFI